MDKDAIALLETRRFKSIVASAVTNLEQGERAVRDAFTPASTIGLSEADGNAAEEGAIAQLIEIAIGCLGAEHLSGSALLFLFVAHIVLLPRLSVANRCITPTRLHPDLELLLRDSFLPAVFLSLERSRSTDDIDGRIFISLVHYTIDNAQSGLRGVLGESLYEEVGAYWPSRELSSSCISSLASSFPNPPSNTNTPDLQVTSCASPTHSVLPFSNAVFDDVLSSIQLKIDEEEQASPSAQTEFTVPIVDDRHWHNQRRAVLARHLGGTTDKTVQEDEWQRKRRLRGEQRFMAKMQWQAESLTGASGKALERMTIVAGKETKTATGKTIVCIYAPHLPTR